jgi:hypothetical protein
MVEKAAVAKVEPIAVRASFRDVAIGLNEKKSSSLLDG